MFSTNRCWFCWSEDSMLSSAWSAIPRVGQLYYEMHCCTRVWSAVLEDGLLYCWMVCCIVAEDGVAPVGSVVPGSTLVYLGTVSCTSGRAAVPGDDLCTYRWSPTTRGSLLYPGMVCCTGGRPPAPGCLSWLCVSDQLWHLGDLICPLSDVAVLSDCVPAGGSWGGTQQARVPRATWRCL